MKTARTPAQERDFLLYYAGVLEREASARPGQNVDWMIAGAARSRREADEIDLSPAQSELFGATA